MYSISTASNYHTGEQANPSIDPAIIWQSKRSISQARVARAVKGEKKPYLHELQAVVDLK